ncbi:hypothetical protein [Rhodococcus erythropolis]|uniref:hypothetical protein n=1 Tax=Rhodococcus erythropolis TaxID=1833 RepID=UPI00106F2036|nr:hypothetical protein [Rhodococcus erythropolis]
MNRTHRMGTLLCAAALLAAAGCSNDANISEPNTGDGTSITSTEAASTESSTVDPCSVSTVAGQMCRTVASASIERADFANPIAVSINTSPTIEVRVATQSGAVAKHQVYPTSTSGGGGLGPTGDFPVKQDHFLTSVSDVTGDGVPEIIVQTGQFPDHAEYQVLRLGSDGTLAVVNAPTYNKWTTGNDVWTTYNTTDPDIGFFRCPKPGQPGVATNPLQSITVNDDGRGTRVDYLHDHKSGAWTQVAQEPVTMQMGVSTEPFRAFDCTDLATRTDRTPEDKNTPFTPETATSTVATPGASVSQTSTVAAPCTFDPAKDGRATTISVVSGDLGCADAQRIAREYKTSDLPAGGNAAHKENGEWHCSSPTAGENERTGRIMSCEATVGSSASWKFDVVVEPR